MSSWFSDLAGKAENILNKIDQNAANVLKNDPINQLTEVKCNNGDDEIEKLIPNNSLVSSIKRNISTNSLKLQRTPKKSPLISDFKQTEATPIKNENKLSVGNEESNISKSNISSSSRRSSCSSRTEGVQTVIEYPIEKRTATDIITNGFHASVSSNSLQISDEDKNELIATKIILAQVKIERDQLKSELIELQTQVANCKTNEIIAELTESCQQLTMSSEYLNKRIEELEISNNFYIKSISELETTLSKLHQNEVDLAEKLAWAKSESEQAVLELQQYRARAQHTLQMKDVVISELKNLNRNGDADDNDIDSHLKQIQYAELTKERETLVDEIKMLGNQLEAGKQYIQSLETKYADADFRFTERETVLNNLLKQERLRFSQLEDTLRVQKKELKAVRDEMKRQQLNYSSKLHEKESDLIKVQTKLSQLSSTVPSSSNISDDRVYSLTQSLVQKQNSLETVTAERNAIRIQLEKMEHQHRETMQLLRQQRLPKIINVNDTDDAKSQVPNFLQENPFDTRVARRVKRAYSSLDSAGIRLGVFMRRYPLIRTLVIVYVAVLHLWVMLVLFTSTPY